MNEPLLALMGFPGWLEIAVIALPGLLLFGGRLPGVARSIGRSLVEFKRGLRSGEEADCSASLPSQRDN